MREILFIGKLLNSEEWVEGYLYEHEPPLQGVVPENYVPEPSRWFIVRTAFADWNLPRQVEFVEVDPETVGQYTGMTDANGNRVFEWDIMQFTAYGILYTGIVEFVQGNFSIICNGGAPFLDHAISNHGAIKIGNIHDNPELLEDKP